MMRRAFFILSLLGGAASLQAQSSQDICSLFGICEVFEYQQLTSGECNQLFNAPPFLENPRIGDICSGFQLIADSNLVSGEENLHLVAKRPTLALDKFGALIQLDLRPGGERMRMVIDAGRFGPQDTLELKNVITSLQDGIDRPQPYLGRPRQELKVRLLVERRLYEIGDELGVLRLDQSSVFKEVRIESYQDLNLVQVSAGLTPYGAQVFEKAWSRGLSLANVISLQLEHTFASSTAPAKVAVSGSLPCIKSRNAVNGKSFVPCL